ncbi:bifunctional methylenetetrahydrofolate dehydrogenase/methenyltetrahydrofolate cyclohydrolase FolD [Chelativorans composti]|jgi:5,10-methylene-tetrahydrofolate dehydrogenase/Methenyl tetrahydrofolate cyclohydrolase|uniref:Bifunctional protein FolD n=1 Tax=Chelativorans composti TaxID=768533 RepID=A0ABW5DG23_9HYPH|nr:bifunctional 5,10-methylenetetrahydrofolate dehydrogenase/5,10-methenyltetrahydrofolate cyclohydrolase [bacterium SGD-2]
MDTTIFTGFELAARIKQGVKARVAALGRRPRCTLLLDGSNAGAAAYAQRLVASADDVGIEMVPAEYAANAEAVRTQLQAEGDAMMALYPIPSFIGRDEVARLIGPERDVDGLHPLNAGGVLLGERNARPPATARACVLILEELLGSLKGREIAVVGASAVVGRPLALMLLDREATVTVCHAATADLASHTREAEVVISATGVAGLIRAGHITEGSILLDVGIVRTEKGLVGDVDLESVSGRASLVTHVPDGVGPVTTACLLENIVSAAEARAIS